MWDLHCYLRAIYLVHARKWLKRKKVNRGKRKQKALHSPWVMHQAILPSTYTPLTEVYTLHFDYSISTVLSWLLLFSLLGRLSLHLIFWDNLLMFRSYSLGTFSTPQKGSILCQYFVLELLKVLYPFPFFFLFYKLLLLGFLPCLGLGHLFHLLSSMLNMASLCYLF